MLRRLYKSCILSQNVGARSYFELSNKLIICWLKKPNISLNVLQRNTNNDSNKTYSSEKIGLGVLHSLQHIPRNLFFRDQTIALVSNIGPARLTPNPNLDIAHNQKFIFGKEIIVKYYFHSKCSQKKYFTNNKIQRMMIQFWV